MDDHLFADLDNIVVKEISSSEVSEDNSPDLDEVGDDAIPPQEDPIVEDCEGEVGEEQGGMVEGGVEGEPIDVVPIHEEPIHEEPVREEPVAEEPIHQEPIHEEPVENETTSEPSSDRTLEPISAPSSIPSLDLAAPNPEDEARKQEVKEQQALHSAAVAREEDYNWLEELGEGAFGRVQHIRLKETGQDYAVKVIGKKFMLQKKQNADAVKKERDILKLIDVSFPLVVHLYSTFQNPSDLFFVMDYCPNGDLLGWIRKLGKFNIEETRFYLGEIILAVEYLHRHNILHRDLKPENVMLSKNMHIKVIDFGTGKILDGPRERTSSFEGTPEYMSPDLLIHQYTDLRSDIWALGVILYQMLTGKLPFRGENAWATMEMVRQRDFSYPDDFDATAKDLCERLLCANADERIGSQSYDEIKSHKFFEGLDWENLPNSTPPNLLQRMSEVNNAVLLSPRGKGRPDAEPVEGTPAPTPEAKPTPISPEGNKYVQLVIDRVETKRWAKFLSEKKGESIVRSGLVSKKRRAFNVKKRQLLLTTLGRLIYAEIGKDGLDVEKGSIKVSTSTVEVKSPCVFIVTDESGRGYHFEDKSKSAQKWADDIAIVQSALKANAVASP